MGVGEGIDNEYLYFSLLQQYPYIFQFNLESYNDFPTAPATSGEEDDNKDDLGG